MSKQDNKWYDGPPPHVGWWNASRSKDSHTWRWWNGETWSAYGSDDMESERAGEVALTTTAYYSEDPNKQIKWRYTYPKNAPVPRVDPSTGKVTGGTASKTYLDLAVRPKLKVVADNTKKPKKVA